MSEPNTSTGLSGPEESEVRLAWTRAIQELEAASAIKDLGNLLQLSRENGGFEAITDDHWRAIGISIERLGSYLEEGSLSDNLNEVGDFQAAAKKLRQ